MYTTDPDGTSRVGRLRRSGARGSAADNLGNASSVGGSRRGTSEIDGREAFLPVGIDPLGEKSCAPTGRTSLGPGAGPTVQRLGPLPLEGPLFGSSRHQTAFAGQPPTFLGGGGFRWKSGRFVRTFLAQRHKSKSGLWAASRRKPTWFELVVASRRLDAANGPTTPNALASPAARKSLLLQRRRRRRQ